MTMTACQESLEDKAEKEASTYTRKNCPARLTENVVLDSMTFDRTTHTFGYYYQLSGVMDNDEGLNRELMRAQLLDGLKNLTAAKAYMDEGYSFNYVYYSESNNAKILFQALFTEQDYKQ